MHVLLIVNLTLTLVHKGEAILLTKIFCKPIQSTGHNTEHGKHAQRTFIFYILTNNISFSCRYIDLKLIVICEAILLLFSLKLTKFGINLENILVSMYWAAIEALFGGLNAD